MKKLPLLTAMVMFGAVACDNTPMAPLDEPGLFASRAGMIKQTITGTLQSAPGDVPPGRALTTPSGICHWWDVPVFTYFEGDVEGPVTFHEQEHFRCDFSRLTGSGPFQGQVTWNGRSGIMSGQWTTNCKPDASQPLLISCDGTMNARGSDGLDGVQFHFKWGPGWYPFPYTGTAFSK